MSSARRDTAGGRGSLLACLLIGALVMAGAPLPDDLSDARKVLANRGLRVEARVAAAAVLMDSGRRSQQEKVIDAFFDESERSGFMEALLSTVRPALLDGAGALDTETGKRVRKMIASERRDWKVHGLRVAVALQCPGLDDKALELLKEADKAIVRNERRKPEDRESVRQEITELRVSSDLLARAVPPSPDFLWTLKRLRESGNRDVRLVAVEAYGLMGADTYADVLAQAIADDSRSVHDAAYDVLLEARRPELVPALIGLLADEPSSIDARILPALFRATGQRYLTRKSWEKWLARNEHFVVLSEEEFDIAQQALVDAMAQSRYGPQGSFFERPVSAHGVVFLLDVSGSMTAKVSNKTPDKGVAMFLPKDAPRRSRMDLMKAQVTNALAGLEEQHFNIITFGSDVEVWMAGGSSAFPTREAAIAAATEYISQLRPHGSTALHAGLKAAFKEDDIRQIFLLSDGAPSVGVTSPKRIRRDVKRWGQKGKDVALHCISMGLSNPLLKELGPVTPGGTYVEVEVHRDR